jgi:aerobic-type carbon monoxide dehydrogenase small subunit (CoxS/CutS family)
MKDIHSTSITVNGRVHEIEVESRRTLADVLRHDLGYTGTHLGCEHGICGACTVLLEGLPVRSCLVFGVQADGCEVETVEGLESDGRLNPLQEAFSAQFPGWRPSSAKTRRPQITLWGSRGQVREGSSAAEQL